MKVSLIFSFLLLIPKILTWYSKCDAAGNCYIGNQKDDLSVYLMPGYVPSVEGNEVIQLEDTENKKTFKIQAIAGYSLYGPLKGSKKGYECAGGLSECTNSYCRDGKCIDPRNTLREKKNKTKLIYIVTSFTFVGLTIIYWAVFFILGYKYNKTLEVQSEFKEEQGYGTVVKKQPENQNNQEDIEDSHKDEKDNSNIKSEGEDEVNDEEDKKDTPKKDRNNEIGQVADYLHQNNN